jgi:hypothetical protein
MGGDEYQGLRAVMGAMAQVLSPHVPIDGMGIVVWSGTFPKGAPTAC